MKVIYKKTILEKIEEEIYKAREFSKEIEKIILTQEEYLELENSLYFNPAFCKPHKPEARLPNTAQVMGVEIEVEI